MKPTSTNRNLSLCTRVISVALACLLVPVLCIAQQSPATASAGARSIPAGAKTFDTSQQAADALIRAAGQFDETVLAQIFGPDGHDIAFTGDVVQDRQRAADFAAEAREKTKVSVEPKNGQRAYVLVGNEDWPFPVPIVKRSNRWFFDSNAGRQEILNRRIGSNELDAINISHDYVEAQKEYALQKREGYDVNQYAQRIISTPGKQDGLTWRNADGTLGGPFSEEVAEAIAQGAFLAVAGDEQRLHRRLGAVVENRQAAFDFAGQQRPHGFLGPGDERGAADGRGADKDRVAADERGAGATDARGVGAVE